jgi:hydroxyethylthiazole kinase
MQHPETVARNGLTQGGSTRQIGSRDELVSSAQAVLARLRVTSPRVHCITNSVAQNFTANALLAAGAIPSMTLSGEEIAAFVARSNALLVNLGTFDRDRREATSIAVDAATRNGLPWVLDPVYVDRAPQRADYARDLIFLEPKALRLNAAEFSALAKCGPQAESHPESHPESHGEPNGEVRRGAIAAYALEHKLVIGLSGATDLISDGAQAVGLANGHPLMAKVTAMGCAASAIVAACLAVEPDAFVATSSALLIVGVAGEQAAARAQGPGSFAVAILDCLHNLDGKALADLSHIDL